MQVDLRRRFSQGLRPRAATPTRAASRSSNVDLHFGRSASAARRRSRTRSRCCGLGPAGRPRQALRHEHEPVGGRRARRLEVLRIGPRAGAALPSDEHLARRHERRRSAGAVQEDPHRRSARPAPSPCGTCRRTSSTTRSWRTAPTRRRRRATHAGRADGPVLRAGEPSGGRLRRGRSGLHGLSTRATARRTCSSTASGSASSTSSSVKRFQLPGKADVRVRRRSVQRAERDELRERREPELEHQHVPHHRPGQQRPFGSAGVAADVVAGLTGSTGRQEL